MIPLPEWSAELSGLYWKLRNRRTFTRPSRSTIYRQIAEQKKRLLEAGVSQIELHLVTRLLSNPENRATQARLLSYLQAKERGESPWKAP